MQQIGYGCHNQVSLWERRLAFNVPVFDTDYITNVPKGERSCVALLCAPRSVNEIIKSTVSLHIVLGSVQTTESQWYSIILESYNATRFPTSL